MTHAPRFTEPQPLEKPDVSSRALGLGVVTHTDTALHYRLEADVAARRLTYVEQLRDAGKVHPNDGKLRYAASRLVGKAMDPDEITLVNIANRRDNDYVADRQHLAEASEGILPGDLGRIRRKFTHLDKDQLADLDSYLDREAAPFLTRLAGRHDDDKRSWADWIVHGATNEQLVNFLQWSVDKNASQQQNPEFRQAVDAQRESFKPAVIEGVKEGRFSRAVLDRLDNVDTVNVWVADPMDAITRLIRGEKALDGITIALPDDGTSIVAEVAKVVPHEFSHDVIEDVYDTPLEAPWIREALAEMSAMAIRQDPFPEGYFEEIDLYTALLSQGSEVIDDRLGTLAYSGTPAEKQQLYDGLDASWGTHGVLQKVSSYVRQAKESLGQDEVHDLEDDQILPAKRALDTLLHNPELIFGEDYKRPPRKTSA